MRINDKQPIRICIENWYVLTKKKKDFMIVNGHENKIVIYGCQLNIDALKKITSVLLNGTFK